MTTINLSKLRKLIQIRVLSPYKLLANRITQLLFCLVNKLLSDLAHPSVSIDVVTGITHF